MDRTERPRPETPATLRPRHAAAGRARRGRLRVFLGAAPGVGKTYAMLNEGRRLEADGRDVVVGFVETHGRAETEAQIGDLEVIPRLRDRRTAASSSRRWTPTRSCARKPEIVLVDELAHTNAPGSPRAKRYEDVEVAPRRRDRRHHHAQHPAPGEPATTSSQGITGVEVRETIPDRVLDEATEVQLVDLPVEALIERLEQGKVYPPERARQALQHFFRAGNLTALRELALRRTAAGVDERLERYMHEHEIDEVWPAAERVVVLVDDRSRPGPCSATPGAWRARSGPS